MPVDGNKGQERVVRLSCTRHLCLVVLLLKLGRLMC